MVTFIYFKTNCKQVEFQTKINVNLKSLKTFANLLIVLPFSIKIKNLPLLIFRNISIKSHLLAYCLTYTLLAPPSRLNRESPWGRVSRFPNQMTYLCLWTARRTRRTWSAPSASSHECSDDCSTPFVIHSSLFSSLYSYSFTFVRSHFSWHTFLGISSLLFAFINKLNPFYAFRFLSIN